MAAFVEYEVQCFQCAHVHDEPVAWLLEHHEVVCPSCGGWIQVEIGHLMAALQNSNGRDEVLDLSHWSPALMKRAAEGP